MTRSVHLFLLSLLLHLPILLPGQTITPINNYNTRTTLFQVQGLPATSGMMYLFGDGYFSLNTQPLHQFRMDDYFVTTSFEVDPYTVTPPTMRSTIVDYSAGTAAPPGSNTTSLSMGGNTVQVGQSWATATNFEVWLIVSFKYPSQANGQPVDGQVKLYLDSDLDYLNDHFHGDWIDAAGTPVQLLNSPFGTEVTWSYKDLAPGEVRHVYAKVKVMPGPGSAFDVRAELMGEFAGCETGCGIVNDQVFARSDKPKDPNKMTVAQSCLTADFPYKQMLDYGVYFYNEGFGYAKDVLLDISIDQYLTPSDITITDSSHPCTFSINPTTGKLEIFFANINLPGLNQSSPHIFTWDQVNAFVTFSVCSDPNLPGGQVIEGQTDIYFDNLPPIPTAPVQTYPEPPCPNGVLCGVPSDEGGDDVPIGDRNASTEPASKDINWSVHPSLVNDRIRVQWEVETELAHTWRLDLIDLSGRVTPLCERLGLSPGAHQQEFDLSALAPGLYTLRFYADDSIQHLKILKQ